jgi:hypothetical protein
MVWWPILENLVRLLRVADQTMLVVLAGWVIAAALMAFFAVIGTLFAIGTQPKYSTLEAAQWAVGGVSRLACAYAFFVGGGYWWRFVVRKLEIDGLFTRAVAVVLGASIMTAFFFAAVLLFRALSIDPFFAPPMSGVGFALAFIVAVFLIFAGRWQLRYNFHSTGHGTPILDAWLLSAAERERLRHDWD